MSRPHRLPDGAASAPDDGGPLLAVCVGPRCSALRTLTDTPDSLERLTGVVRDSSGAVLVTSACFGPCALASIAAVAHRYGHTGACGRTLWLSGVQQPDRATALLEWIGSGGPPGTDAPDADVPAALLDAVVGLGPPVRLGVAPRSAD